LTPPDLQRVVLEYRSRGPERVAEVNGFELDLAPALEGLEALRRGGVDSRDAVEDAEDPGSGHVGSELVGQVGRELAEARRGEHGGQEADEHVPGREVTLADEDGPNCE